MENVLKATKIFTKKEPEKRLLLVLNQKSGRSNSGRVTIRHRGGGAKKLYRIVDFGQEKLGLSGKVVAIEYDPNRTAYLALVEYQDGQKKYILAPANLKVGDEIICAEKTEIKNGNRMKLQNIPVGTQIYNIEVEPGRGGKLIRSAGATAIVLAQENGFSNLEMPSGEVRRFFWDCFASIGQVSHPEKRFEISGKAGRKRLQGWRPTVRGTAMNPPDHPHGGGQAKTGVGMPNSKTPWGKPARGIKTRKNRWTEKLIISRGAK